MPPVTLVAVRDTKARFGQRTTEKTVEKTVRSLLLLLLLLYYLFAPH